jgi:hypothetical protein
MPKSSSAKELTTVDMTLVERVRRLPGRHTMRMVGLGIEGKEGGGRGIPVPFFGFCFEGVA